VLLEKYFSAKISPELSNKKVYNSVSLISPSRESWCPGQKESKPLKGGLKILRRCCWSS